MWCEWNNSRPPFMFYFKLKFKAVKAFKAPHIDNLGRPILFAILWEPAF